MQTSTTRRSAHRVCHSSTNNMPKLTRNGIIWWRVRQNWSTTTTTRLLNSPISPKTWSMTYACRLHIVSLKIIIRFLVAVSKDWTFIRKSQKDHSFFQDKMRRIFLRCTEDFSQVSKLIYLFKSSKQTWFCVDGKMFLQCWPNIRKWLSLWKFPSCWTIAFEPFIMMMRWRFAILLPKCALGTRIWHLFLRYISNNLFWFVFCLYLISIFYFRICLLK